METKFTTIHTTLPAFLFSVILMGLQPPVAHSQTIDFSIFYKGNEIGHIKAVKETKDSLVHYQVTSDVEYNSLLYDYQRTTKASASFTQEGQLVSCQSKVTKYDELEEYKVTRRKGDYYECFSNDGSSFKLEKEITRTATTLYFIEPKNISHVFSESYQELCPIEPIGDGTYQLTLPGDKTNHYIYHDGQLQEVKVIRTFLDLSFKRK